jgi:hypothetical protein
MEGGGIYALTALLYGEITIDLGRVKQPNFHDYRMLGSTRRPRWRCTSWIRVRHRGARRAGRADRSAGSVQRDLRRDG